MVTAVAVVILRRRKKRKGNARTNMRFNIFLTLSGNWEWRSFYPLIKGLRLYIVED
jgi:hypothetical protein